MASGCSVHELLRAARGKSDFFSVYGQLKRRWTASADCAGDFNEKYVEWMRDACRAPGGEHFWRHGAILAELTDSLKARRSAAEFRLKFGPSQLPFFAAATGISGVVNHQNSTEQLHVWMNFKLF